MSTYMKMGAYTDGQGRDNADPYTEQDRREPNTTKVLAKSAKFTTTMNSEAPTICIDCGDVMDTYAGTIGEAESALAAIVAAQTVTAETKLDMDILRVRGNHDIDAYAANEHQDWFDIVLDKDNAGQHPVRLNTRQTDITGTTPNPVVPESYTYDIGGYRFIAYQYGLIGAPNNDDLTWLGARIAETDLPVIIFTHKPLWYSPKGLNSGQWQNLSPDTFYAVMDAYPNVQAVFSGHYHQNGTSMVREGVHYISLAGSVWEDTAGDNAYFIIEIKSDAVKTDVVDSVARSTPNIKITGYGSHGTPYSKDYDTYSVMGA